MERNLRALVVEDSLDDADLLLRALRKGGYDVVSRRVETRAELRDALDGQLWDIVFSDWTMPELTAPTALAAVKEHDPDLPFILISGTIGESVAVEALRGGAHDFLLKGHLARLLPAVNRELREATNRRECRRLQEQLVIADRLVSVGTVAAGIAHELNNPLAVLMTNIELALAAIDSARAKRPAPELAEVRDELADALEAAERMRSIVCDVKLFSRPDGDRRGPVDVQRVIDSSLRMASTEIRDRARLVKNYHSVPPVMANDGRLGQVVLNLLINAAQSIPEGAVANNEIRLSTMLDGDRVRVAISDTGCGIPPENLSRIFEPFFTTKPSDIGMGLGLAICQRIIKDLGGELEIDSRVGEGTTCGILLPLVAQAPACP